MTTQAITLAEFLMARIAEDEDEARVHPDVDLGDDTEPNVGGLYTWVGRDGSYGTGVESRRLLAECEAKRRLVALHSQEYPHRMYGCKTCREWEEPDWPCSTLRLLAQPYADHPEFREEWKL